MKPWHTLFRNRNGGLCVVCSCLVFIVVVTVGTWAGLCIYNKAQSDFPKGIVELIGSLAVVQGFKNYTDARFPSSSPSPAPPPA